LEPAAPQEPGFLLVAVKPWANVIVDGREAGSTPLEAIALAPGPHIVRINNALFEEIEKRVTIRPGETEKLVVDLTTQGVRKKR
jgi:hypothetical protein